MPSLASLASPAEARALERVLPWNAQVGGLVSTISGEARDAQKLGEYLDDFAAVFEVRGDGPMAQRTLEPVTYLAQHVARDDVTMARIGALLTSIDDLPSGPLDLRRVSFTASDQAAAGVGLLSELRVAPHPKGTPREVLDAVVDERLFTTPGYARHTGYYQHGRSEIAFSPRVSRQVLHAGFDDPLSPLPELSPAAAARIAPHELTHATQHGFDLVGDGVWSGVAEAGASIVDNLRSGATMRAIGRTPTGIDPVSLRSQYNGLSTVLSGLARLGGQNLDDPAHVARLEQRIASLEPFELLESMSADAARWQGTSAVDMHDAVADGLRLGPTAFHEHLAKLGVQPPDTSLEWMYAEARRRAGVTSAA
ncbi:MAG: hypothetical protein JWL76_445 [Thermoleophilia bacterium]|nr:hypothetical protein [Thermoleophilia bacterium]